MTAQADQVNNLSVSDLAHNCARQTSRRENPPRDLDSCYELFRRACAAVRDEDAWEAIIVQYGRLVRYWLGQYGDDDNCQEVFLRFWRRQESAGSDFIAGFDGTRAIVGFLKVCTGTVRIECWRKEKREQDVQESIRDIVRENLTHGQLRRGDPGSDFEDLVRSRLKNDQEKALVKLMYDCGLKPRDVLVESPTLFPDVDTVYRVKENLLRRLRRDAELQARWASHRLGSDEGGGFLSIFIVY
jgi:DNA-directed RNA polymerase specialized sigma24 family protein